MVPSAVTAPGSRGRGSQDHKAEGEGLDNLESQSAFRAVDEFRAGQLLHELSNEKTQYLIKSACTKQV